MTMTGFRAQNHPQQVAKDHVDDRAITDADFLPLLDRFRFTVDAAAAAHNAKLPHYWTRADDALAQDWTRERVWCNPPYSDIPRWVRHAWAEYHRGAELIVMLLPNNRCEQRWWQELIEPHRDTPGSPLRVEFLPGRMRFVRPDAVIGPKGDRPPFGCCLVIWDAR